MQRGVAWRPRAWVPVSGAAPGDGLVLGSSGCMLLALCCPPGQERPMTLAKACRPFVPNPAPAPHSRCGQSRQWSPPAQWRHARRPAPAGRCGRPPGSPQSPRRCRESDAVHTEGVNPRCGPSALLGIGRQVAMCAACAVRPACAAPPKAQAQATHEPARSGPQEASAARLRLGTVDCCRLSISEVGMPVL